MQPQGEEKIRRRLILVFLLGLASLVGSAETWDSWYTCNYSFRHHYKQTGTRNPVVGEISAAKLTCLRPGCQWEYYGNQVSAFMAEVAHWKVHVPDKKKQNEQRFHSPVDGPHYSAVEGQPRFDSATAQPPQPTGSPTEGKLPMVLRVGEGMALLVGEQAGVCSAFLVENFGDWLFQSKGVLLSVQVSGPECFELMRAVNKDNDARLRKDALK